MDSDESVVMLSDSEDEWTPSVPKPKTTKSAAAGEKKPAAKRAAKPKEPIAPKAPKAPKVPKEPKVPKVPKVPKEAKVPKEPKPRAPRKPAVRPKKEAETSPTDSGAPRLAGQKRKERDERVKIEKVTDCSHKHMEEKSGTSAKIKQERLPLSASESPQAHSSKDWGSLPGGLKPKKESSDEDFSFGPCPKKQRVDFNCHKNPLPFTSSKARSLSDKLNMNWDLIQVLATQTCVQPWVCVNIIGLLEEENTVPFMVRYRKEMINHMEADAVRDIQRVLEELCALAKKTNSCIQTLKKDSILTVELEQTLRSCKTTDELDHVFTPYKKGTSLSKVRRAKALGLEVAASALMNSPHTLDLNTFVKPGAEGLSTVEEVATGVEHILADMIAKDPETLTYVKTLCEKNFVTINSSASRSTIKEMKEDTSKDFTKQGQKDINKFKIYFDFNCNIQRVQPHQTLAMNRGESLKILTVKVNIPDRVKNDFISWCINNRWRPKTIGREENHKVINNAVVDSYKRLISPFLCRSYRTKLTSAAEKDSIAIFASNLRKLLLGCPVRGCVIMAVDPGFRNGCKLALLSPTSQILHTDVVYPHHSGPSKQREAEKLRHLMIKYSCNRVVIGNGKACRETESFFSDLISRRFFHPLNVSYCITNEAGASNYSVSPEAIKEMPNLDPNLRSAVSIGRRVQDPLAELVKIDPKHLGIGTYQHDAPPAALKASLDGVVQDCVSFVGVDINICSVMLMRHVAGLSEARARGIAEWREQKGPFTNREQLKLVKGMGPKSYQQCAGFIRINPQTFHSVEPAAQSATEAPENPAAKKGKKKADVPTSINPLDQTCIHPESYDVAQRFLSLVGGTMDQIGSEGLRRCVERKVGSSGVDELARSLETTPETLKLIIDGLTQPPGFDIRQNFEQPDFKRGIVSMNDLQVGTVLTGRVCNTTLFGAFVDIGVGHSGLIHKSRITLDKLPASQRRQSLILGPGERVEVRVLNVDLENKRISLDLIRVLQ